MKFLKYFCAASLLAASAGTLWSCDDDDDKRLSDAVLASVSSLTFEAQDTSEKIITVYADADWVTEIPDWVTVTPTEGTGVMDVTVSVSENMRDGAMDNPRKAKLVFKGRTLASRAEVLVSQVGNKFRDIPEYQKIGDVIALDDEAAVKIPSALVMAVTNKGFIISDDQQSGAIFVEDTEKVAVGDKVCVWGTKSSDGAKLPIISCAEKSDDPNREGDKVEVLSSGATVTYPTPTDLTEQIDTYTSAERSYVTVTGFFNGSTVSVADDAKYSVSALDIPEEMGLAKLNGHNITVSGYYAGLAEPVHRIIVTTIVDKGAVETVYWTEDFEWLEPGLSQATIRANRPVKRWRKTTSMPTVRSFRPRWLTEYRLCRRSKPKGTSSCAYGIQARTKTNVSIFRRTISNSAKPLIRPVSFCRISKAFQKGKRQPSRSTGVRCDKVAARSIRSI